MTFETAITMTNEIDMQSKLIMEVVTLSHYAPSP
jgi:hypothetical protein